MSGVVSGGVDAAAHQMPLETGDLKVGESKWV